MLLAFREVVTRSEMFARHHVQRDRLSVRERMTDIVARLASASFVDFVQLFAPEKVAWAWQSPFIAILELVREGLIDNRAAGTLRAHSYPGRDRAAAAHGRGQTAPRMCWRRKQWSSWTGRARRRSELDFWGMTMPTRTMTIWMNMATISGAERP